MVVGNIIGEDRFLEAVDHILGAKYATDVKHALFELLLLLHSELYPTDGDTDALPSPTFPLRPAVTESKIPVSYSQ